MDRLQEILNYDTLADEQLLALLDQNDRQAFTSLFRRYWQGLYRSACHVLQDEQVSEDIIQEAFLSIWERRHSVRVHKSLKSYLYSMVRFMVFRYIADQRARSSVYENLGERLSYDSPESGILVENLNDTLESTLSSMPQRCREVYVLSRERNLSHKEISRELNISVKTVENHLSRALRLLRVSLKLLLLMTCHFFH